MVVADLVRAVTGAVERQRLRRSVATMGVWSLRPPASTAALTTSNAARS